MYIELKLISIFFKVVAVLQLTFATFGIIMLLLNAQVLIQFMRQLNIVVPFEIVVFIAAGLFVQAFVASLFVYVQGQLIDVALSIEKSVFTLRESAGGLTPLLVSAQHSSPPSMHPAPTAPDVWQPTLR